MSDKHSRSNTLSIQVLSFTGLMGALAIVLSYVASIQVTDYLRIGFSSVPNRLVDYLLGPFAGAVFGGVMDVVKYLCHPTGPFFPGYTLSAAVGSLFFGLMTHGKNGHKVSLPRIFAGQLFIKLFVNICLNTLWSMILYGNSLAAILPARALSNLIQLPVDTAVLYVLFLSLEKSHVLSHMRSFLKLSPAKG
ncbi:MAG: folate family ECF transporter S component [Lachnospiraceae bacterium]